MSVLLTYKFTNNQIILLLELVLYAAKKCEFDLLCYSVTPMKHFLNFLQKFQKFTKVLFILFNLYINLPDLQESGKSAIPRATVKQMYFHELPRYYRPLKICFSYFELLAKTAK